MAARTDKENVVVFENVGKTFGRNGHSVTAIEDLTFSVKDGEYLCVLGRSGCGKSTSINLLLGLLRPERGKVLVHGLDPYADFNALKGRIGCIFQNDRLLPWRSAMDNVLLPREILGNRDREAHRTARNLLARFGLEGFENARPSELSGGMRQRVAVARALASDPDILLADEAFGHLDEATGEQLRRDFKATAEQGGKAVLHVTHSIDEALDLGDRIVVLGRPGKILATFDNFDRTEKNRNVIRGQIREYLDLGGWDKSDRPSVGG